MATLQVLLAELDHVARPEGQKEIPRAECLLQALDNSFLIMGIDNARVPGLAGGLGHELARHPGQRLLPGRVDVHHYVDVGRAERLAELRGEVPRAREKVGLKEGHEPAVLGHFFANAPSTLWPTLAITEYKPSTAAAIEALFVSRGYRRVLSNGLNLAFRRGPAP